MCDSNEQKTHAVNHIALGLRLVHKAIRFTERINYRRTIPGQVTDIDYKNG